MRVRLKTIMAGPAGTASPGAIVDLDRAEAYALIEGGFAEQLDEAAIAPGGERAELPANRRAARRSK